MQNISRSEFYHFFRANLTGLIGDLELSDYVADMMVRFSEPKSLSIFFDKRSDSEKFDAVWRNPSKVEAYKQFRDLGDSYLWLCGFYPAFLSKQRKPSLGMKNYTGAGQTSYNYAVSVGNCIKCAAPNVGTLSRVSDNFRGLAKSIFELKTRIDIGIASLSPRLQAKREAIIDACLIF